ncbi:TetR-like C-terminal domain-containing protein, partial [Streptomyces huiliensis]|uniref:TetR-like C-terminal domain-containing protein n=1 Tax=Streptomyces huiliensis TaxID=2876027 RepID=UPI001CC0BE6B
AASAAGAGPAGLAHAWRDWALADPQRYLLIYGTPVPGYRAPEDITGISDGIMATLVETLASEHGALVFWTRLHGVLSLELAGHFAGMDVDPALLFQAEVDDLLGHHRAAGEGGA